MRPAGNVNTVVLLNAGFAGDAERLFILRINECGVQVFGHDTRCIVVFDNDVFDFDIRESVHTAETSSKRILDVFRGELFAGGGACVLAQETSRFLSSSLLYPVAISGTSSSFSFKSYSLEYRAGLITIDAVCMVIICHIRTRKTVNPINVLSFSARVSFSRRKATCSDVEPRTLIQIHLCGHRERRLLRCELTRALLFRGSEQPVYLPWRQRQISVTLVDLIKLGFKK